MADELKQPPFPFELMPSLKEKEEEEKEEEEKPFPFELMPSLSVPTTSSFGRSLGLTPIEEVLPEEAPAPKRELATSPVIEEMKAEVEAEVEQGGIWKLRDEADEVSKQFQAIRAEQEEAEAMELPTGAMIDKRSLLLDVWNKKNAELQTRRTAFKKKTGFTPDEYGRSEKEIKLLRKQRVSKKLDRIEAEIDAGTTGPPSWEQEKSWRTRKFLFLGGEHTGKDIFTRARDTDTASLLFGPSKRTEGDWRPLAKSSREGILPWKKGLDEAFWEAYDSGPKDRNKGLKLLSGVMGAVFEGTPKTPLHKPFQAAKKQIDKSVVEVDKVYGKDSWQAKSWGAYAGVTTTIVDFADIMVGNTGGVATIGVGSVLGKVAQAGKGTAAGTTAAVTTAATEAAFATHILDGINQSLPQVLDTWYDPNASTKEKAEAVSGTVLAALFAVKLGHGSAKNLEGALKSQYGIDINLQTATRAELNNAGVRIVRVRENKAAKAEGREPITQKEGETLMEYATRVAAEKVLPKLKGEHRKTFNRKVGELQALERMRLEERKSGEEIPVEETTIVEPILSERPVRPLPEAEPQPIVVPPEVLKFEPEAVDRRADAEAGSEASYYDRPPLQVKPDPETVRFQEVGEVVRELQKELTVENLSRINAEREAKILEAMGKEPAAEVDNLKGFDRADDGKVYVDRQLDIEEFPDRFTSDDVVAGIELKTVTEPINEALFDPRLKKRGGLEGQQLEIRERQRELQAKGVFKGSVESFPKEMRDKWIELMRDKGDALERWEADHKELYDQFNELEKQYALIHEKFRYTSSIEEVLTRPTLESEGLVKEEPLTFDTTYHVTRTINVPSVLKEGIVSGGGKSFKPVDPSHPNYKAIMERGEVGGVGGSLGRVHSFESLNDAVAWASRMDWELNKRYGTGEISIIPIRGGKDIGWQLDPELAKSGDKGLRRYSNVSPEYLGEPVKVGKKLFDDWSKAAREDRTLKLPEPAKPAAEAAAEAVKAEVEGELPTPEFEIFTFGRDRYDINTGYGIARRDGVELTTFDAKTVKQLSSALVMKDPKVVAKADTSLPVLLGTNAEGFSMVIDGHHRVARAIKEGTGLDGYVLSKEQTAQVKDAVENPKSRIDPKPAAKAAAEEVVKDAKVDEAAKKVAEEKARIESAAEIASVASRMPDMGGKMKVIVKREIEMLRRDGATAEELGMAAELEADPSSIYEVYPTSEWAHKLTKYTEAELNVLKESMKALESPPEGLMGVLEFSLVDRKLKAWKKAKPEDSVNLEKEYRDALQAWSSAATGKGQWVQAQRYNPHKSPELEVDAIKARIESSVGGKPLTPKESAELLKLVEKSQDTLREFQEKQREYHRDPTEPTGKVFDEAYELRVKAEAAAREQWEYMRNHEPQLWADIYVSILQGNLLTPATLVLNPIGNIVPLPFRAGSRTAARVVDLIDEFFVSQSPSGKAKLKRLQEELKVYDKSEPAHGEILAEIVKVKAEIKENRTTVHAKRLKLEALREELKGVDKSDPAYIEKVAEIARLEKETLGDIVLQPWSGTWAKGRGFLKGLGADRLAESLNAFRKAPKGEGRTAFMEAFKHRRYSDSLSSLFYGQKVNMYEAGQEFAMTPLSPAKSLARVYRSLSSKEGRLGAEGFVKNLAVGIGGIIPTGVFRVLGAGDLPFRQAEMYRVIENYGERFAKSKGWTPKQRDRWIEQARKSPEIAFNEKQLEFFENESAKASFQNDTWATKVLSWANVGMRAPRKKGALRTVGRGVYMGYRTITPYQKTLVNIFGELGGATPLGMVEAANPYLTRGQKKYAIGRAAFGTSVYALIQVVKQMTNDDGSVISVDYSTGMTKERKASIRYLSNKHQAHGTWNWSAARRLFRTGNSGGTKAGDNITDLQKAGPFGWLMLANAAYGDLMETLPPKERKGVEDNWYRMLASHTAHSVKYQSRYLLNQSFAQNAKDVAQSIAKGDDPQQWLKPFSRALPALAIPNTLDWLYGHSADNRYRTDYSSKDGAVVELKQVWKKKMEAMGWLKAKVKGALGSGDKWSAQADGRNPLIFNMWGQPIDRVREGSTLLGIKKVNLESSLERYALSGFGVLASGEAPDNPVAKVLWGLWKATRDNEIVPAIPRRDISREGVDYKLNRDQYAVYQRLVGLRRMKGPPAEGRWQLTGKLEHFRSPKWAGMDALIGASGQRQTGNHYKGGTTNFEDLTEEEQVKEIKRTYDGARRSAGDYLVKNFMLKKGGPTKEDLIALADLGEDATEKEARAAIKSFSINLDNLDKLEVTEKPSGRLKK